MGSGTSKKKEELVHVKTKVGVTTTLLTLGKGQQDFSASQGKSESRSKESSNKGSTIDDSQLHLSEDRKENRKNILEFLESSKKDRLLVDSETATHGVESKYDEPIKMEDESAYDVPKKVEHENVCPLCNKPTSYMVNGFPCRVCCKVFHLDCLREQRHYTEQDLKIVHRAKTPVGWSCDTCDDICKLLSPDEMQTISDDFDKLDVNRDADISFDEFMEFQKKEHELLFGKPMDDFEEDLLKFQFEMLDADKSGSVDYKEFMKHQAKKILGRKDKLELVKLLTANEVRAAKLMFDMLDADSDGTVSEAEARNAYRSFYSMLDTLSQKKSLVKRADDTGMMKPDLETKQIASHVCTNADLIMEADENHDCIVDWKEFLRGQALPVISSRPNKYGIPNE